VDYTCGPLLLATLGTFRFLIRELVPLQVIVQHRIGSPSLMARPTLAWSKRRAISRLPERERLKWFRRRRLLRESVPVGHGSSHSTDRD
jgi:hypothetical protein